MSNDRHLQGEYNKLKSKNLGPCTILEKFGDNAYQVELLERWKIHYIFNIKHLQLHFWEFDALNSRSIFFFSWGTNVEHLHSIDNFSTSSSIDPEQIEEFYLCKTKLKSQGMK